MPVMKSIVRASHCLVAVLGLSGCGGGVFIGFGSGFDDSPPSVSLTAAAATVAPGQPVKFSAAAADENGVDHVSFFRADPNGEVFLGRDFDTPYEFTVTAPTDGRTALLVFARAVDNSGNV